MDYEKVKQAIKEILEIASTLPEPLRQPCFETLLEGYLIEQRDTDQRIQAPQPPAPPALTPPAGHVIAFNPVVRVFMQRRGVTEAEINRVLLYDGENVYFVKEPNPDVILRCQNEWALLLALKNAILKGEFSTDPEAVRSICKDKGCYDPLNFAKYFKKKKYSVFFRKALEAQGEPQALTNEGEVALAELVRALTGTSE